MIAKLQGIIDTILDDSLIIMVGGVGYHVFASSKTLTSLSKGSEAELLIETHVREDHFHLYGFSTSEEKAWFMFLTKVQGVGNKMGLELLSSFDTSELFNIIASGDKTMLTRANGVGPKLAQRIISELKDKVSKVFSNLSADDFNKTSTATGSVASMSVPENNSNKAEAISALVNLGYKRVEAFEVVAKASNEIGADASVSDLIKESLQLFSKHKDI